MNYFKRAVLSIRRHKFKTGILFCIIFLLSSLTATAITIRQAIINTDAGLRAQLPAVVTLRVDEEKLLYYSQNQLPIGDSGRVTAEMVKAIGQLPYVRTFDFNQSLNVYSSELERLSVDTLLGESLNGSTDFNSLRSDGIYHLERFTLRGIYYHNILDIQSGLLELVEGRTFLPEEIENGKQVTILSQDFMEENDLILGDTINLDFIFWGDENTDFIDDKLMEDSMSFEIVGVFNHQLVGDDEIDIQNHVEFLNRIYVPITSLTPTLDAVIDWLPELGLSEEELEDVLLDINSLHESIVFLLNDPEDLVNFKVAADHMIPDFWIFSDLSNAYEDISVAMATIMDISNGLFVGATFSTVLSLGLLILMFLRERQHEIGIYLALGDYKRRIFAQIFTEILVISIFSITLSLVVGNFVASAITENMIRAEMANQIIDENRTFAVWSNSPESLGFSHTMTHEEMLEMYDATMTVESILAFYAIVLATVIIATFIPTTIAVNKNPKDLLLRKDI